MIVSYEWNIHFMNILTQKRIRFKLLTFCRKNRKAVLLNQSIHLFIYCSMYRENNINYIDPIETVAENYNIHKKKNIY